MISHLAILVRAARPLAVLALILASRAVAGEEIEHCVQTPEIDPAYLGGALVLLFGGLLILTDRLRRRSSTEG